MSGFTPGAFEPLPIPGDVLRFGHYQHVSVADFEARSRYQSAGGFRPDDFCQAVFGGESRDHFAGADRVLIRQDCDPAMPSLWVPIPSDTSSTDGSRPTN